MALLVFLPSTAMANGIIQTRSDHWTQDDEKEFGAFITAIGQSNCRTVNACLHDAANPFRASDRSNALFRSDCADLPYVLRFYYAWKRGLPFSYVREVSAVGRATDIRYSTHGNRVEGRHDVLTGEDAQAVLNDIRDDVSSATYRIDPEREEPENDLYSAAISPSAIHAGTVIYDPNGHLAIIWKIDPNGRIRYIDAHPDNSVTRGFYDERFVRASPGMGAGFKNWRPIRLVGAHRAADGMLWGGHMVLAHNDEIPEFSLIQFYGTDWQARDWRRATFALNGQAIGYYDYVRAVMSGGRLHYDPLREVADMVQSNCTDLRYRVDAVLSSLLAGLQNQPEPERLPSNIYGTDGDWEAYATPSRDARLKTAFVELRNQVQRFLELWHSHDRRIAYDGFDLAADMLHAYDRAASDCRISYQRTDGSIASFGYEEARRRLFLMSFDPYQCVEHRWGATGAELATCRDGVKKRRWYQAEQILRNQIERTYEARMDFTLGELEASKSGSGAFQPPDTDVRAYLRAALLPSTP